MPQQSVVFVSEPGRLKGADGKLWCELLTSNEDINLDEFRENMTSHHFALKVRK